MPTKTGKTYAETYPNDLTVNQSSGVGVDATTRKIHDGVGQSTSISLSDDVLSVQPVNDNTTGTLVVNNQSGSSILSVDTTNSVVKAGASQANVLTQTKSMGLYDFSPSTGYHNPLIAHNMMFSDSGEDFIQDTSMFGNGDDPATTLDLSADGTPRIAVACYWYMEHNITIDVVRQINNIEGASPAEYLTYHLMSYERSGVGDLSDGTVHAQSGLGTIGHDETVYTNTLTLVEADIDAGRVVIGFVEQTSSAKDITCVLTTTYHIR